MEIPDLSRRPGESDEDHTERLHARLEAAQARQRELLSTPTRKVGPMIISDRVIVALTTLAATVLTLAVAVGCAADPAAVTDITPPPTVEQIEDLTGQTIDANTWECTDGTTIVASQHGWARDGINGSLDADGNVPAADIQDCTT